MELKSYFVAIFCLGVSLSEVVDSVKIAYTSPLEVGQQYWNDLAKQEMETVKKRFSTINPNARAKNIIFFIGDGMGIPTLTAARTLKAQLAKARPGHPRLHFEEFPHVGLVQTYNTDRFGPDSAGTATAYLCGVKANLGVIGLDERVPYSNCSMFKQHPDAKLKCIPEIAAAAGKSIGFVTTKSITDASPAPIYSATPDREWQSDYLLPEEAVKNGCRDIAVQLIDDGDHVNVALGGGMRYFAASNRKDNRNLTQEWVDKKNKAGRKAKFISTGPSLRSLDTNSVTDLLGIFADGNLMFDQDRISSGSDEPTLAEMALTALKIVQKNPNGYFLFIEGARIDSAHHENMAGHALYETLVFENAIAEIMKEINTEETIVLVSADHSHVFSYGSYMTRENFILDPSDSSLDEKGMAFTNLNYANGPGFVPTNDGNRRNLTADITNSLSYRFETAVPLDSETHGAEEVAVYATGPQAHLISALIEQNTIAHVMMYSSCIGPYTKSDHCQTATGGSGGLSQPPLGLALALTLALMLVGRF